MNYFKLSVIIVLTYFFVGCSDKNESRKTNAIDKKLDVSSQKKVLEKIQNNSRIIDNKNVVIKTKSAESSKNKENRKMKAPDFLLADLDGNTMSFSAYEGQVVLLTFWGTWCGPCRQEIPDFIKLYDEFNNEGLEIIGIAIQSGNVDNIKKFSEYYNIN